ncbi:PKD domain-containing protein [Maribacter litopenaei]|uniref:PKD domain-containing protein n=1 Tax=Maribacter litopenaei TaxID=2976127 RepID=A0ABY5YB23_9FLAO|nr:PKD domain-containing protein [Maribacter litopenaei]UWX56073.1 PKD domain-containing protein [Maribacter litopenaei]
MTHKSINDLNATLDEKARTYLDNNCAYCHQPATGNRADFDLRLFNTLSQTGLLTAGMNQTIPAMGLDQQIVYAGDASKSQVYHRANSIDPGIMMPPLAKGIVDTEGVALLEAWINQLQPPAPLPAEGEYRIVNRASGETLQVSSGSTSNGQNVDVGSYEGLSYQHFAPEERLDGFFELRALHSNRYLDVQNGNTQPNANVWQYTSNGTVSQTFELLDAGDGTFNLVNKISDYFLGQDASGNVLVVENDGSDALRWEFLPTSAPFTIGIEVDKSLVITNEDGATDNLGVSLMTAPVDDVVVLIEGVGNTDEYSLSETEFTFTAGNWDTPQILTITGLDDLDVDGVQYYDIRFSVDNARSDAAYAGFEEIVGGYNEDNEGGGGAPPAPGIYRIINVSSGLSMEVMDEDIASSVNIEQGLYQAGTHEQFELRYEDNGLYSLIAQHSGKAVDVELGNANPGTNVWHFAYNGTISQLWTIQDAGNGTYHIISDLGGHYLGIEPDGNISVNVDNGGDIFRWEFKEIQTPGNGGVSINKNDLYTDEDGDTDTFTVVLTEAPTATVTVGIMVTVGADEVTLSTAQLTFEPGNWDVPRTITVTGVNDDDVDGIQDYTVEAVVIDPIIDTNYDGGVGDTVAGLNYDNDGGNGAPRQGIYRLQNVGNTESLMPENGGLTRDTNFVTGTYDASSYQHFELLPMGNDQYSIRAIHGNFVVDIENGNRNAGANVWMYTGNGNIAQLFEVVDAGDGTYFIISVLPGGYYLTVAPDGNVIVDAEDGSDFYRWRFLPTGFPPEAIATADITSGNAPLTVQFTGSASTDDKNDIVDYLWDFGNGETSTELNPSYTFADGGTYQVLLTVTDGDGYSDESDIITINVNAGPTAVASASVLEGNAPLEVSFTGDQSTDDVAVISYDWDFGNSGNSTLANPVQTFSSPGTYTVSLTVTDDGGLQDTTTLEIVVNENGAPVAVASSDIFEGNAPLDVTFTGDQSTDDIGIATYSWDFGDGTTSNLPNPTHTFATADVYTVTLTVTDDGGLEDSDTITITASDPNGAPIAVATADISEGTVPLEVSFTGDQSTDDVGISTYSWDFGDGSSSSDMNPIHTFVGEGTYQVVLTVADANGLEDTDTITITVNPSTNMAPVAVATSNISSGEVPLEVAFTVNQSTDDVGIVTYNWDFGDGNTSADVNPIYTFNEIGEYTVILTVIDEGGLQSTDQITITVSEENVAQEEPDFEFVLAPNPTTNYVDVVMSENFDLDQIRELCYMICRAD